MGRSLNKDLQFCRLLEGWEGVFVVLKVEELIMESEKKITSNWEYEYFLRIAIWNMPLPLWHQATEVCWFQISLASLEAEH